jgi:cytosine/adenosine deaminase-related metal-dependent hydrolase
VSALGALDSGITTVFDWAHIQMTPQHTDATIGALREAGLRAIFGFGPPLREDRGHRWPHDIIRLRKEEFSSPDELVTLALASVSPEHVPEAMFRAHLALAREADVIISIHSGMEGGNSDVIGRIGREGLLGPDVNLVHCNNFSPEVWRIVAGTGASVCITPEVEMQMGHGVPPIQPARAAGVKPCIGIDVETSVPGDMWTQMRVLYALQRMETFRLVNAGREAPPMLTPHDVLEYATMVGAKSARLDSKVGSLTPGKQADIVLLRTDMLNVMPAKNLESMILLNMDCRNVDTVLVAGRVVKRNGRMLNVDMEGLRSRLVESRDRIYEETVFEA